MSATNVKVKVAAPPSDKKQSAKAPKRNDMSMREAKRDDEPRTSIKTDAATKGNAGDASEQAGSVINDAKPYIEKHGHALAYGLIGLVAAALILSIGFWPVLLLAVLAAVGVAIGRYRDGDAQMHAAAGALANRLKR